MHCIRIPFHYSFQTCFIKLFNIFNEKYKIYIGKFPFFFFFFIEYFSRNFKILLHLQIFKQRINSCTNHFV